MSNDVNKLTVVLEGNSEKLQKALAAANQSMQKFDKQSKKVGGTNGSGGALGGILATAKRLAPALSAAFAVRGLAMFGKEAIMLGAKLEGIKNAFQLIEDTGKVSMNELKSATRGAVDEITLMSLSVQANNFKVPLENLASFFEFATIRAAQTGESVEYLTRSIVTGIGRKSPLILDNLGITLVRLKEAMGKVGRESASVADISAAVAIIAKEETESLKNLGLEATTVAQKMAAVSASFQNLKASIGEDIASSSTLDRLMSFSKDFLSKQQIEKQIEGMSNLLGITKATVNMMGFEEFNTLDWYLDLEKSLVIAEKLQKMVDGQFQKQKFLVNQEYGDVSEMDITELNKWKEKTEEDFNNFKLPFLGKNSLEARAIQSVYKDRVAQLNEQAVLEKQLSDKRASYAKKYSDQLKFLQREFDDSNSKMSSADFWEKEKKILEEAKRVGARDEEDLGLADLEIYDVFVKKLNSVEDALMGVTRAGSDVDELIKDQISEIKKGLGGAKDLTQDDFDADNAEMGEEEISEANQRGMDYASSLKMINAQLGANMITEREAASERKAALEDYMNALIAAGEEIPEWMKSLNDSMKGSLFDKDNLQELSQMWSGLASSLGQLAGAFNPDSGIAKFLRLGQSIAAAAAAMAALGAVFDPTAPARSIGAAVAVAGALAGVVGSIGNISGGFGGNGGGAGYNAALASGGQLYTDIRGRDLRILLDREGKFSDRRGG